MKKTLTINLNNIVFHIDDDAYEMLHNYLSDIATHFQSEEEKREIMADIEARIGELFSEKMQRNKGVVTISDVEEIIEIMGKPSQYADEDEDEAPKTEKKQQKTRRFYRDPENAILGGIAAGVAAYFGIDVTLVRVVLVILAFVSVGNFILVYLIIWIIAPQAITSAQRLEMQGEDVTIDSIKSEVNNVKNFVESDKFKQGASTFGQKVGEIMRFLLKLILGFFGSILGFAGIIIVGVLLFVLFLFAFEPSVINEFTPDLYSTWSVLSPDNAIMMIISLILVIGCPIFMLIYWAIRIVSKRKSQSNTASWVVFILWLAGIFMLSSLSAKTFFNIRNSDKSFEINWDKDNSPLNEEVRTCEYFTSIEAEGNIELTIKQDSVQEVLVSSRPSYLRKLKTTVENGVLRIYTDGININKIVKVHITTDSIRSIVAKGACFIKTDSQLNLKEFNLDLIGASRAEMDLKIDGLFRFDAKGASFGVLTGSCDELQLKAVGASSIEATDLISRKADVHATGACHADVYASENINAIATGASEIECKGSPKTVKQIKHFGSSINIY